MWCPGARSVLYLCPSQDRWALSPKVGISSLGYGITSSLHTPWRLGAHREMLRPSAGSSSWRQALSLFTKPLKSLLKENIIGTLMTSGYYDNMYAHAGSTLRQCCCTTLYFVLLHPWKQNHFTLHMVAREIILTRVTRLGLKQLVEYCPDCWNKAQACSQGFCSL